MKKTLLALFFLILFVKIGTGQNMITISGYVTDKDKGETLIGANIFVPENLKYGTTTNAYGFYSLSIPQGKYTIRFSYLGYQNRDIKTRISRDTVINVELMEGILLNDIVIDAQKEEAKNNVSGTQVGTVKVEMESVKKVPALMGEVDVLKTIQLLPGVTSVSEGNSGFYVRGGGADQNLILLDEAVVYNSGHMLGFFSVFNADAVKSTTLIKGGMPANYGQRLSSVVDIKMKEGNDKYYSVDGGIGVISSRLTMQGPLIKDKSSFIVSGRRTYVLDLVQPFLKGKKFEGTNYYFYDLNAKINYKISDRDRLYLSGYFGRDIFGFNFASRDFAIDIPYGNSTATLRWNHLFNNKLFLNTSLIYNDYNFSFGANQEKFSFKTFSGVRDFNYKMDLDYYYSNKHKFKTGINYTYHRLTPQIFSAEGENFNLENDAMPSFAHEYSIYALDEWKVNETFLLNAGLRMSAFSQMGNYTSKFTGNVFTPSQHVKTFLNLDPRINVRAFLSENTSMKAAVTYTSQYLHLVSNSSGSFPNDIWVPSTEYVKPEKGIQYSLGIFKNFFNDSYQTSIELYYKDLKNQIEFREDYVGGIEDDLEKKFVFGKGRAYGMELFVKKSSGNFTGWIGYTLSRTERSFDDIEDGRWFKTTYDKLHDLSIVLNYNLSKKWSFNTVFVYGSGRKYTPVSDLYVLDGSVNLEYGSRNSASLPAYHRLDFSVNYYPVSKNNKWKSHWSFGLYNVYNRKNPAFIDYNTDIDVEKGDAKVTASKITIFPIIPSITYNFSWNSKK
ncbi:MAG TPA: TonB-dependent receptor [Bacteroidetes bacterium]|nr:TonB-dependent receptor [Bacteroidota bacterium]